MWCINVYTVYTLIGASSFNAFSRINGYGWPLATGGPMRYAGTYGLMKIFMHCLKVYETSRFNSAANKLVNEERNLFCLILMSSHISAHLEYWKPSEFLYDVAKLSEQEYVEWLSTEIITPTAKL